MSTVSNSTRQTWTESDYIYALAHWLGRHGVTVHLYAHDLPCAGMYRAETVEIFLNEPNAHQALMVLAHEAGHWVGYLIGEKRHSYQRERQAFAYGWKWLRLFGAPVTRTEWIEHHRNTRGLPTPATEHLYRDVTGLTRQSEGRALARPELTVASTWNCSAPLLRRQY